MPAVPAQAIKPLHMFNSLKAQAKQLKQHTLTVYFAARDPRTPLMVRALAVFVAAYALLPVIRGTHGRHFLHMKRGLHQIVNLFVEPSLFWVSCGFIHDFSFCCQVD